MAHLDKPILPELLYRYRSLCDEKALAQEIAAIKEQYIWCSTYRKMNDPMEGFYEPSIRLTKDNDFTRVASEIVTEKRAIGICCFSDTHDNELMWAHYASNYTGICVGYRPQPLIDGLPDNVHLIRLAYGNQPPPLGIHNTKVAHDAAVRILSHKKSNWHYEREWRVLGGIGRLNITSKACVRELYLGSRISSSHKDKLLAALAKTHIRIHEMRVSGYTHKWRKIKGLKSVSR
jgi:hypothetical protein